MTQEESKCMICGNLHMEGIRIRGKLICSACEKELVGIQVDEPLYDDYKERVKSIWDFDPHCVEPDGLEPGCSSGRDLS